MFQRILLDFTDGAASLRCAFGLTLANRQANIAARNSTA